MTNSSSLVDCWSALYPGYGNAKEQGENLRQDFRGLAALSSVVNHIVNFGFSPAIGGKEPFALTWTLGASEVVVVERNDKNFKGAKEVARELCERVPICFDQVSIRFLQKDMTEHIPGLPSNYFHLSYCANVLQYVYRPPNAETKIMKAITQIARVVRPGGWVIACEPSLPSKLKRFFKEADLVKDKSIERYGVLKDAYIYKKPA